MELKDFIKASLLDTLKGIEEAQDELAKSDSRGAVNPSLRDTHTLKSHIKEMEFDVAVTASSGSAGTAKAGIVVASFGAGGSVSDTHQNSTVSRIKFSIPILPSFAPIDIKAD